MEKMVSSLPQTLHLPYLPTSKARAWSDNYVRERKWERKKMMKKMQMEEKKRELCCGTVNRTVHTRTHARAQQKWTAVQGMLSHTVTTIGAPTRMLSDTSPLLLPLFFLLTLSYKRL